MAPCRLRCMRSVTRIGVDAGRQGTGRSHGPGVRLRPSLSRDTRSRRPPVRHAVRCPACSHRPSRCRRWRRPPAAAARQVDAGAAGDSVHRRAAGGGRRVGAHRRGSPAASPARAGPAHRALRQDRRLVGAAAHRRAVHDGPAGPDLGEHDAPRHRVRGAARRRRRSVRPTRPRRCRTPGGAVLAVATVKGTGTVLAGAQGADVQRLRVAGAADAERSRRAERLRPGQRLDRRRGPAAPASWPSATAAGPAPK